MIALPYGNETTNVNKCSFILTWLPELALLESG